MDQLCRILHQYGYDASVQNNALQILKRGEGLKEKGISLNADSGLIGTPQMGCNKKLEIKRVLMPELLPGAVIHVESSVFKGFVVIDLVRFTGSNFGVEWEANLLGQVP